MAFHTIDGACPKINISRNQPAAGCCTIARKKTFKRLKQPQQQLCGRQGFALWREVRSTRSDLTSNVRLDVEGTSKELVSQAPIFGNHGDCRCQ